MAEPSLKNTACPNCDIKNLKYVGEKVVCGDRKKTFKLAWCVWSGTQRTIDYINVVT